MGKPKSGKYHQGIYKPIHPEKCLNKNLVEFRSGLEYKYFYKIDKSPNVIRWGSETVWVPYYNPIKKRTAQYWVDLYLETKSHGTMIVEIKPKKEIKAITENKPPKMTKAKKKTTFLYESKMFYINKNKWETAKQFAENKGWTFWCISEDDLDKGLVPFL